MAWPPTLDEMKLDMKIEPTDTRDDGRLTQVLDAAVVFVQRVRPAFNYDADPVSALPDPTADVRLGVLRLAGRWHVRRRSPDALIQLAEMGASRVPQFDSDIERLLGIGRFAGPVFA